MNGNDSVNFTPFNDVEELNNKRKLKIISQSPYEMVVEISRLDTPGVESQSNAINANNLNCRFNEIKNSLESIVNYKKGSIVEIKNANGEYEAKNIQFDSDPQMQINI